MDWNSSENISSIWFEKREFWVELTWCSSGHVFAIPPFRDRCFLRLVLSLKKQVVASPFYSHLISQYEHFFPSVVPFQRDVYCSCGYGWLCFFCCHFLDWNACQDGLSECFCRIWIPLSLRNLPENWSEGLEGGRNWNQEQRRSGAVHVHAAPLPPTSSPFFFFSPLG